MGPPALAVVLLAVGGMAAGDGPVAAGTAGGSEPCCAGEALGDVVAVAEVDTGVDTAAPGAAAPSAGGVISGLVLADRGADGALDPAGGDTPLAGVLVTLTGHAERGTPVEATTRTGPDGRYAFSVPAGTYRLVASQPPAFDDGPDVPGPGSIADGNDSFLVTLRPGATSDGNSFAELPRAALSGSLFDDGDGDGVRTGTEPGIPSAPVTLTGTDGAGNPVRLATTTAADGLYLFPRLRPGDYAVATEWPVGFLGGTAVPGSAGGSPAGPTAVSGIRLGAETTGTGYHFAAARPAGLSGVLVDEAGTGVAGVPVTVRGRTAAGAAVERATSTAPDGRWAVADLPSGTYTVLVPLPPGFGDGPDTPGSAGGTPSGPNSISGIALAGGQQAGGYVFTLARAAIAGQVFVDVDGDGSRGPAEPGLGGVTLTVSGTDVAGGSVDLSTSTGPDGAYRVGGLLAGTYSLSQAQPALYGDGADTPGSAGGAPTAADTIAGIVPTAGSVAAGYDFGERGAQLEGVVADQDGAGLPGLAVTVTGSDTTGAPVDRATSTGPGGTWAVGGLPAGSYAVSAAPPPGYGGGPATPGTAGGVPAGPGTISGIALGPGVPATGYRFTGTTAAVSGSVYLDRDRDGVRDPYEAGIDAVTVTLSGTDVTGATVRRTVTTGGGGRYRVDRLLAGEYAVAAVGTDEFAGGPGAHGAVTVPAGAAVAVPDAGLHAGTLRGQVADETGAGVPGVTVTLSGSTARGRVVGATATTGPDGRFTLPDLAAGRYTLAARQPAGHGDGPDAAGSAGGAPSAPNTISEIALAPGQDGDGYRFTTTLASLGGVVFADLDRDGARGPGEPGIGGVVVTVTGAAATGAAVERRATTGPDGTYLVDGLLAGRYTVIGGGQKGSPVPGADRPGSQHVLL